MPKTRKKVRMKQKMKQKMKSKNKSIRKHTTKKTRKRIKRTYRKKDFSSGDGMLTSVWGPSLWHYLHTMSFNYPVKPTNEDKKNYKKFIMSLKHVLPCKYCRINLRKNLNSNMDNY